MYPAQTSLIPVQVALARFLESQLGSLGVLGILGANYPYWYLGTTPFRYLTGPILPGVLAVFHRLVPNLSLFEIMFGLVGIVWLVGGIGVYLLVKTLNDTEKSTEKHGIAVLAALFYLLGPIVPFLFRFSDGLYLIAFSFLPYTLLMYLKVLQPQKRGNEQRHRDGVLLCILIAFVILLDSLIIPSLVLGMAAIFLGQASWKEAEEKVKSSLVFLFFSFLVATLWYTPGYWWTLLGAPSLAGKGLAGVIVWLGKLLPTVLAFGIAIFSVKFFKKKDLLRDFCFYWLFIFGFLTLIRFLSDPDFWLDWMAYGTELQLGVAVALGMILNNLLATLKHRIPLSGSTEAQKKFSVSALFSVSVVAIFIFGSWTWLFNRYVLGTLQKDIEQTVEYRIGKELSDRVTKEQRDKGYKGRVFLSGSTAFWLNTFFDIPQVRGGVDQASVDSNWRKAVWEIREGTTPEATEKWLKILNISYLVVHTQESEEFYHDFSYPEKFELAKSLKKVFQEDGDIIYQME